MLGNRIQNHRSTTTQNAPKRGQTVIYGVGHDAEGGHIHITEGDGFRLVGGSKKTHAAMLERLLKVQAELRRRGLTLRGTTREEAQEIAAVVASFS